MLEEVGAQATPAEILLEMVGLEEAVEEAQATAQPLAREVGRLGIQAEMELRQQAPQVEIQAGQVGLIQVVVAVVNPVRQVALLGRVARALLFSNIPIPSPSPTPAVASPIQPQLLAALV
jgi:hypothetical protein